VRTAVRRAARAARRGEEIADKERAALTARRGGRRDAMRAHRVAIEAAPRCVRMEVGRRAHGELGRVQMERKKNFDVILLC
jgi:uncharacterized membrane protein